ncbi:XRE family transcriptional regulator [Xylella fastidiosa]|uniref:XRE family transcriptional regulator n=1 Tax=Xylella fastidiosa TaxID=2371 RepID=UPI001F558235|nr:helix-turn-helix transcriptional regulator [Xylella fastidiosa]
MNVRTNTGMNTNIGSRIRAEREHQRISRAQLAKFAGVAVSTLSDLELGSSKSTTVLHKFAERLGVSPRWLETGYGDKYAGVFHAPTNEKPSEYVRVCRIGEGGVDDDFPEPIRVVEYSASFIRSLVGFLPHPGRLALFTCKGDSMAPTIKAGETVLVDTEARTFESDGIYLVNLGHGQQIKRLHDLGKLFVVNDNNRMPPFEFPEGGVIGGKVHLVNRIERL